jgi:hypothetical protein
LKNIAVRKLATLEDTSEALQKALKNNFWIDPAPASAPYKLLKPHKEDGSDGQALRLMQIFKHKVLTKLLIVISL